MIEEEWRLSRDARNMLAFLHGPVGMKPGHVPHSWRKYLKAAVDSDTLKVSVRKLMLFTAACAWRLSHEHQDLSLRKVLDDIQCDMTDQAERAADEPEDADINVRMLPFYLNYEAVCNIACRQPELEACEEWAQQSDNLREIFGNPFRPGQVDPAWLAWEGGTVVKLAQGIYDQQAFDRMPILADALEDAGCCDRRFLEHSRGPEPHVRGCWLIDCLLNKS